MRDEFQGTRKSQKQRKQSKNKKFNYFSFNFCEDAAEVIFGNSKLVLRVGLTASLVLQFFSRELEKENRFSRKYQCRSRKSHKSREKGKMRYIVQFARLGNKQNHNSLREISVRP
jgi:hypothetical protein